MPLKLHLVITTNAFTMAENAEILMLLTKASVSKKRIPLTIIHVSSRITYISFIYSSAFFRQEESFLLSLKDETKNPPLFVHFTKQERLRIFGTGFVVIKLLNIRPVWGLIHTFAKST